MENLISICIPTYEMYGKGKEYLTELLQSIYIQTYKNFEVIISDHSIDDEIKILCESETRFKMIYNRLEIGRGNSSINMNNAIKHSNGSFIKIMHMDDFFCSDGTLEKMANVINNFNSIKWGALGFDHINEGKKNYNVMRNVVGCPSTMYFINDKNDPILFDENLIYYNDKDISDRLKKKYGVPTYITDILVTIRIHSNQVTRKLITNEIQKKESEYLKKNG